MAYQPESPVYDVGVFQLEVNTPVLGGVGGASNSPLLSLANRTAYLKQHVDALEAAANGFAPINSPNFTGTPTAPDVALGDRSSKIANTKFVQDTVYSVASIGLAGGAATLNLTAVQAGAGMLVFTGLLTANIAVIVPNAAKQWTVVNATTGAFSVTLKTAAGTGVAITQGTNTILSCDATNVIDPKTDFNSPSLTGTPTAPTAAQGTRNTQLATAAFVHGAQGGIVTVNVAGGADVVLNAAQAGNAIILLTGVLTGNINLIAPAQSDFWIVGNGTTGNFTVTVKTAAVGSVGTVAPQGFSQAFFSDGTNVSPANSYYDSLLAGKASLGANAFTGVQTFTKALRENYVPLGAGTNIDTSLGNYFSKTITANTALTVSNVAAAPAVTAFVVNLTNAGAFTTSLWANVHWSAGQVPALSSNGTDAVAFYTLDGGASWNALLLSRDSR